MFTQSIDLSKTNEIWKIYMNDSTACQKNLMHQYYEQNISKEKRSNVTVNIVEIG